MTLIFDIANVTFFLDNGVLNLTLSDDGAERVRRKYVKQDPYAKRECSNVSGVAERHGFTEKVVRAWLDDGCPFFRAGSDIRLDDRLADEWFAKRFGRHLPQAVDDASGDPQQQISLKFRQLRAPGGPGA